jgi:hypothetical protein
MAFVSNQRFALAETYFDQTGLSDELAIEPSLGGSRGTVFGLQ